MPAGDSQNPASLSGVHSVLVSVSDRPTAVDLRALADDDLLHAFCRRWRVTELSLFGSTARGEAQEDSDIDLLVSFAPGARWSLFDLAAMEEDLEALLGRNVDLVTRRGVEQSHNAVLRASILGSTVPLLVGGEA